MWWFIRNGSGLCQKYDLENKKWIEKFAAILPIYDEIGWNQIECMDFGLFLFSINCLPHLWMWNVCIEHIRPVQMIWNDKKCEYNFSVASSFTCSSIAIACEFFEFQNNFSYQLHAILIRYRSVWLITLQTNAISIEINIWKLDFIQYIFSLNAENFKYFAERKKKTILMKQKNKSKSELHTSIDLLRK